MNALAVLLLMTQATVWTISPPAASVGDTVRLTRRVSAEPGVRPTVLQLEQTPAYTPLTPPIVAYSEGHIVVRYQLAFFETGDLTVAMPDIELSHPDGRTDLVAGGTARVGIGSVLPTVVDTLPPPQPSLGPISSPQRSLLPAAVLVTVVLLPLVGWGIVRRRTLPRPVWNGLAQQPVDIPIQQWIMAGESKAVVAAVSGRLRDTIDGVVPSAGRQLSTTEFIEELSTSRPDWPIREIDEILRALDRALYAPAVPSDLALLVDQVDDLVKVLPAEEVAE